MVWPIVLLLYVGCVSLALTFNYEPALFILGLPWMMVVSMLSMLIVHAGGVDALQNTQIICYGINALILLILSIRRILLSKVEASLHDKP
jgi:small basic protein